MQNLCPHCHRPAFSAFAKLSVGSKRPRQCEQCGEWVKVPQLQSSKAMLLCTMPVVFLDLILNLWGYRISFLLMLLLVLIPMILLFIFWVPLIKSEEVENTPLILILPMVIVVSLTGGLLFFFVRIMLD